MRSSPSTERFRDLLTPKTLPMFLMFFFWGFGTGGLWLVRPLFAYSLSESFLLVALVSAVSAAPRTFASPITGYLADRFGRKWFVILGAVVHVTALVGQFFSTAYLPYFFLEMLGGSGHRYLDDRFQRLDGRLHGGRDTRQVRRTAADLLPGGNAHRARCRRLHRLHSGPARRVPLHRRVQVGGHRRGRPLDTRVPRRHQLDAEAGAQWGGSGNG